MEEALKKEERKRDWWPLCLEGGPHGLWQEGQGVLLLPFWARDMAAGLCTLPHPSQPEREDWVLGCGGWSRAQHK
jgi:hypothetical protein